MHGRDVDQLGGPGLPWADAVAILHEQRPERSALHRHLDPKDYDRSRSVDRLEALAVLLMRGQIMMRCDIRGEEYPTDMPETYEDLFSSPESDEKAGLMSMEEIDARMGWKHDEVELTPQELLSFEEIDERMGRDG